jgi:glycosyltransferase involved in cell wall biosynthesis
MALKVPVIAYASSAIPDTLADAGVLLSERSPNLMAGAIDRLISDEELSFNFAVNGRQRYEQHFTNERIEVEFFNSVSRLTSL